MIYTITSGAKVNGRPTKVGVLNVNVAFEETEYVFTLSDFTTGTVPQYEDPEGDALSYIRIGTLGTNAGLHFNFKDVEEGQIVTATELNMGLLTFEPGSNPSQTGYTFTFEYDAADVGTESLSGLGTGQVNVVVAPKVNLPPDNVGDATMNVKRNGSIEFSVSNFTTDTSPQYSDPEGDAPYSLKILTLPDDGNLYFNGALVNVNQEILFSEIDLGYLTYTPDQNINSVGSTSFTFSISDEGSKTFSS